MTETQAEQELHGLQDSRRLTGPNVLADFPGAVIDAAVTAEEAPLLAAAWEVALHALLEKLRWPSTRTAVRHFPGGVSLLVEGPMDALYAATEINEWAWAQAVSAQERGELPLAAESVAAAVPQAAPALKASWREEANPPLLRLQRAAERHGVVFLTDDDHASVGLGAHAKKWPVDSLPEAGDVNWEHHGRIPVAMITGTNGKTTTVRLLAAILREAGHVTGLSSTDALEVDDTLIDAGDWSGPGGARAILRDRRVQAAVLETARGGLLRRGLNVPHAHAAAVLNVAEDHFGEWGVHALEDLADAKLLVARAVGAGGRLVLNADDVHVWERGVQCGPEVMPFSLAADVDVLASEGRATGRRQDAAFLDARETLCLRWQGRTHALAAVDSLSVALGGAARHNVANALAAASLAAALGVAPDVIARGLASFSGDAATNPGRLNRFQLGGVTALVDFAHNPHGLRALVDMTARLPAERRVVVLGQAGDREDADIRGLADAIAPLQAQRIILKEMVGHARGRDEGAVVALIETRLLQLGTPPQHIEHAQTELDAVRVALDGARNGDLLLLLSHVQRDEVLALMQHLVKRGWKPGAPLPAPASA